MKKQRLILVVDDEREIRTVVKSILELEGYAVVTAVNGRSALAMVEEHQPDLVILDITMPDLDGFMVLELIRQKSKIPVIMLSARNDASDMQIALELGADDYIRKPFSNKELLARIQAQFRRCYAT